ncbi:hypothetical protein C900_05174 [Fulvivirga imtechensis AK7]|uniref:Uncharacterized protein n=1 Tax=Fulvivirga imtechensis AK7 TaxID=1237149 RepID=L8JKI4_9BACT|nr:hypothetical protein C900_05174 [Fulvivirga imtechensis AK7]
MIANDLPDQYIILAATMLVWAADESNDFFFARQAGRENL